MMALNSGPESPISRTTIRKHRNSGDMQDPEDLALGLPGTLLLNLIKPRTSNEYEHHLHDPIRQMDILDDGLPPEPRAGYSEPMSEFRVHVHCALRLPPSRDGLNLYSFEMTYKGQVHKSPVREGHNGVCDFNYEFDLAVPSRCMTKAFASVQNQRKGPQIAVTLYDCGKYSRSQVVGQGHLKLKELLHVPHYGQRFNIPVKAKIDLNRDPTEHGDDAAWVPSIQVDFFAVAQIEAWSPGDLTSILEACEGKLELRAPGKHMSIKNQFGRTDSSASLSKLAAGSARVASMELQASGQLIGAESPDVGRYWRESLEEIMDSLTMQLIIICVVLLDVAMIIVYTFIIPPADHGESASREELILSTFTVSCFLLELSARTLAMGFRFFKSVWNLFDFFVVWASVMTLLLKFVLGSTSETQGLQSVVVLRIVSRVAVMLRVARVLLNLRRANQFSGQIKHNLRTTVSQNRRRYRKHGFDLDLTYITNRVISMAAPAFGQHSAYRNDINVVARFLSQRHYGHFMVFNLCDTFKSSDGITGNYDGSILYSKVCRIPFEDHGPPLMAELLKFVEETAKWCAHDTSNIMAVHCKGGKGRTGLMISAFLLWSGHRKCCLDALELFTFRRTADYDPEIGLNSAMSHSVFQAVKANQTVEGPSQIRYLHYLEAMLYTGINAFTNPKMHLASIHLPVGPIQAENPWFLSYEIKCMRAPIKRFKAADHQVALYWGGEEGSALSVACDIPVWGDVRINFFRHQSPKAGSKRRLCFFMVFNTSFYQGKNQIVFKKSKVDIINKDKDNVKTDGGFNIMLNFKEAREHHIISAEQKCRDIFGKFGRVRSLERGEPVLQEDDNESRLILITDGLIEGVVKGEMVNHPLGTTVDSVISRNGRLPQRCPIVCMMGPNSVIGAAPLLLNGPCMTYRVRSQTAEVIEIRKPHSRIEIGFSTSFGCKEECGDLVLEGLTQPADLAIFYRGLSVSLATYLSRVRLEAMRISNLRAFNDRTAILADKDENECLTRFALKTFKLPMTEKLLLKMRTACSFNRSQHLVKRRFLLFDDYLILDPAFFGPEIANSAEMYPITRFHSVAPGLDDSSTSITLRLHETDMDAFDSMAKLIPLVQTIELSFQNSNLAFKAYLLLSAMCRKSEEIREQKRKPYFTSPSMQILTQRAGRDHRLKNGQRLDGLKRSSSLYIVKQGTILLMNEQDQVERAVTRGECFGELFFALDLPTDYHNAVADGLSHVVELPLQITEEMLGSDHVARARFYHSLCQVIAKDTNDALQGTFPGRWNNQRIQLDLHDEDGEDTDEPVSRQPSDHMGVGPHQVTRQNSTVEGPNGYMSPKAKRAGLLGYAAFEAADPPANTRNASPNVRKHRGSSEGSSNGSPDRKAVWGDPHFFMEDIQETSSLTNDEQAVASPASSSLPPKDTAGSELSYHWKDSSGSSDSEADFELLSPTVVLAKQRGGRRRKQEGERPLSPSAPQPSEELQQEGGPAAKH